MSVEGPKRLRLNAEGPCVAAGMINLVNGVEIMNPDHVICTLDDGATLGMELTVNTGSGYVPASASKHEDPPIGLVPIDAIYSPIRQVAYKVENTRVGQRTDFDKLILTIETDGSVNPEAFHSRLELSRINYSISSTLKSRSQHRPAKNLMIFRLTGICCAKWTNWNYLSVQPIA